MHIDEFITKYGTSQRRLDLIGILRKELEVIASKGWDFKVYVYGSVVNSDVDKPDDIDCLFSVSNKQCSGIWKPIAAESEMHAWPIYIHFSPDCFFSKSHNLRDMVQAFNQNNKLTGENVTIEPHNCIEVTI